eukprot:4776572-Ditylum_brightwellii.AAC.1
MKIEDQGLTIRAVCVDSSLGSRTQYKCNSLLPRANYITLAGAQNACMAGVNSAHKPGPQAGQAAPQAACHTLDTCVNYNKV